MDRCMLYFIPFLRPAELRAKLYFLCLPSLTQLDAVGLSSIKKASPHPRDHVPLCNLPARLVSSRRLVLDSIKNAAGGLLLELDSLFGGLPWASSLLFSLPRPV